MKEYIIKVNDSKTDIMGSSPLLDKPKEFGRCEDCRHWEPETDEEGAGDYGHCRHPFGVCNGQMTGARWFCGDWEG